MSSEKSATRAQMPSVLPMATLDCQCVAVATVVVFGTLAIFLYPVLFQLNQQWQLIPGGANGFGLFAGSTVHEVAQVVAAPHAPSAPKRPTRP